MQMNFAQPIFCKEFQTHSIANVSSCTLLNNDISAIQSPFACKGGLDLPLKIVSSEEILEIIEDDTKLYPVEWTAVF